MEHTAHTLATRHFPGLVLSVDCTGTVSVLDQRDRDPMRPHGLRRFVATDVVMPFGGVDPHYFPESIPLGQAWLDNLTRADAEDIAVRVVTGAPPILTDSWSDDPDRTTRRGLLP